MRGPNAKRDGPTPAEKPAKTARTRAAGGAKDEAGEDPLTITVRDHPHCAQLAARAAAPFAGEALRPRPFRDAEDRVVSPVWPCMTYRKRLDADRSSCHWGQLKLFESEIRCLTECFGDEGTRAAASPSDPTTQPLVVYVGAAPGRHIKSLAQRFAGCRFELYDPADFDDHLVRYAESSESGGRVKLMRGFFDETAAAKLQVATAKAAASRKWVFLSDIRTADEQAMTEQEVDKSIRLDMARQRRWVQDLRPTLSVLKFRLPWGPGKTPYLRGRVLVQAFPPCTSTETRLLVRREDLTGEVVYDQEVYEQQLMHHNTVGRAQVHDLGLPLEGRPTGLDGCYDCAALVASVRAFLAARAGVEVNEVPAATVLEEVTAVLSEVGAQSGRTLATPYHVSSSRHTGRHFTRRTYRDAEGKDKFAMKGKAASTTTGGAASQIAGDAPTSVNGASSSGKVEGKSKRAESDSVVGDDGAAQHSKPEPGGAKRRRKERKAAEAKAKAEASDKFVKNGAGDGVVP